MQRQIRLIGLGVLEVIMLWSSSKQQVLFGRNENTPDVSIRGGSISAIELTAVDSAKQQRFFQLFHQSVLAV